MAHQNYQEMLTARALNALDSEDARTLEAHVESCAECRKEVVSWQDTAAMLAFEPMPLEPSFAARARILEVIRAEMPAFPENQISETRQAGSANVVELAQRRPRVFAPMLTWAAVAAAVVFAVLIASIVTLWQQNRAAREELARLAGQMAEANEQLARQRDALGIVAAPGARMTELAGTDEMPAAHATLAFERNGRAILMARGLPPPPAGKAYQLWFITGGRPFPGKVFTTDQSGAGMLTDQIPAEALKAAIFAITLEPEKGVPSPTGAIYLKS